MGMPPSIGQHGARAASHRPRPLTLIMAACAVCALALSACSSLPSTSRLAASITPYKIEVVQGNVVTKEQADAVKVGMTRTQIRETLGSPLLTDVFHGDRWDYVFTIRRPGTDPQRRHVVVMFDGDIMKSIEAPNLPTEQEFIDSIATYRVPSKLPTLALTDEQVKALPVPALPAVAASAPEGPARVYPPLEPVQP
ncbi:MAG: outer membrane protein assembly factor BamE [Rhizobacter sp.]|nr:outer membrane protein assembly factor BamE [Rhizobacter sp.]